MSEHIIRCLSFVGKPTRSQDFDLQRFVSARSYKEHNEIDFFCENIVEHWMQEELGSPLQYPTLALVLGNLMAKKFKLSIISVFERNPRKPHFLLRIAQIWWWWCGGGGPVQIELTPFKNEKNAQIASRGPRLILKPL